MRFDAVLRAAAIAFSFILCFFAAARAQSVAELRAQPEVFDTTNSGLGLLFSAKGFGPKITFGDVVAFEIECIDNSGTALFSSADRRAPQMLEFAKGRLAPALEEGMLRCRNGSSVVLRAPARLTPERISGPGTDTLYYYLSVVSLNGRKLTQEERALAALQALVYPNPATETAFVEIQGTEESLPGLRLSVFDENGLLIFSKLLTNDIIEIDARDWPPGAYFLFLEGKGFFARHKLVLRG